MNYRKLFTPGPNKIIQASAGTGKTFILSKYYCSILDDWLNTGKSSGVDNILVLTFTNKAAAEMKAKIFQDLKSLSAGKNIEEFTNEGFTDFAPALRSDDSRFKGEKEKYLRLFGNNKITTIDAFCGQILRRYCDRMNLDPLFSTEDEAIDKKLREESWKEFLTRENRKQNTDLYHLLDYLNENQLKTACFEIHDKKQELESWRKNSADSESLELRKTVIEHYAKTINLNQFLIELNTLLSSIREFPDDKWCRIHIPTLEKVLNSCQNSSNNETCISDCLNNIQGLFLKANGLEYYKVANSFTKDKKLKSILKDFLKILPELLPTTLNNSDLQLFDFYPQLHNFSESFSQFLSNKRRNLNLLSFDDVIRLTGDLLRRDLEIRKQLHEQYKYILVDEFQDTNDKRWEIIRMILDPENTNDIQRLFIVGDTKQSIYAFQNADVKVMNRASAFLKKQSATELYTLETNFRSSANYINKLINPLFSSLMPSEISEVKAFDSIYENCQVLGKFKEADSPLILNLSEKDDITDPKGASQCANAAAEAVHWCEKNLDNWKEKNEPVAVLLRKFTNIQFYQEAFRKKDLNFKIISGKSFWQQQEIRDIEQLLRFLNNPHDDPALLALLRSPLLNCRDKDIYEAASQSKKSTLFGKLAEHATLKNNHTTLKCYLESIHTNDLWTTLNNIWNDRPWQAAYLYETNGEQRLENLEKLYLILHNKCREGSSLSELLEFMETQITHQTAEGQAELPGRTDIQIMTVHKAKGLEFPIVILPDIQEAGKNDGRAFAITEKDTMGLPSIPILDIEKEKSLKGKSGLLHQLNSQHKEESEAESLRLLYVALTRAKYQSVITLRFPLGKGHKKNNWWDKYLRQSSIFNIPDEAYDDYESIGDCLKKQANESAQNNKNLKTLRSLGEGEIYFTVRENSDACPSQKKEPDDLPDIFTPLQLPNIKATQRLSPHDLMEAHAAPVSPALKVSTEDPEYPRHLGNLFHEVMEYQWWHSEHAPNINTLIKEKYPSKYLKKLQTDIREHLECFKESSFFAIVNQLPSSKLFTECPLMAMAELEDEKILLQGVADLVYESEGQWHVLDYKSSYDANREEAYLLQLKCYQWMLHANYGIKALAHIFYSDCGKSVSNAWSPSLSKEIFKTEILKNHPHSLENIPKLPVKPGKNEKTLFIHPTRRAAEEYKLFLSKQEVNHPGIKHMTLNQLLLIGLNDKKRLTPTAAWLLVKKSSEDMEIELSQGQHQLITEAFQKADENDGIILDEWQTLFKHYLSLRKDLNYLNDLEIITNYPYNFFDETRIILTDTWSVRHRDYLFLKMISEHCKGNFYYRKDSSGQFMNQAYNFSEKDLEKNKYFHRLPDTKDLRNPVILFRNPREEIEAIAENILKNYQSEKIENIKIALADMNGWMPTLSRILDLHGIPWYNNVGKNLLIHPLGILALDLLKMITARENCEWSAIYHFFSSPLVENSLSLSEIDLWAGTKDITKLRYILSEGKYNSEKWDFDKKLENLKDLLEKEGILTKGKRKLVAEEFQNIYHRLVSKTKASKLLQGEILYQKIPEMLRHISDQILMSGITFDPSILMRLFREELQSNSSKSDHHSKGIEIVSLMDAASIPSKILFLPGCNEGMLPQNQTNNPILKDAPNRHLDQNLLLFFSLLNRCPDLHISACEEDSSGKALDISSFLQNVTLVNYPAESQKLQNHLERIKTGYRKLSPKQHHYGKYWGKYPSIENTPKSDLFKGNTGLSIGTDRIFSANSMDILLKCPMKYAFRYLLGINSLNESYGDKTFAEIGNSVHHIIAEFSKSGGYDCSTAKEADAIMEKCIQTYEEEKGLDTHTDALFKRNWQPYVKGLANNGKSGLLYEFVYRHYENFQGFQRKAEEFAFGKEPKIPLSDLMPDIYIRGFIDKILVNEEENIIYIADIKSGNFSMPNTKIPANNMSSQLLIYYIAAKHLYPNYRIILSYEQIKSLSDGLKYSPFLGEGSGEKWMKLISLDEPEENPLITQYIKTMLEEIDLISTGNYPLTSKDPKEACAYCDFEVACRIKSRK